MIPEDVEKMKAGPRFRDRKGMGVNQRAADTEGDCLQSSSQDNGKECDWRVGGKGQ